MDQWRDMSIVIQSRMMLPTQKRFLVALRLHNKVAVL